MSEIQDSNSSNGEETTEGLSPFESDEAAVILAEDIESSLARGDVQRAGGLQEQYYHLTGRYYGDDGTHQFIGTRR